MAAKKDKNAPEALILLSDKYGFPYRDMSGNGHHLAADKAEICTDTFADTDFKPVCLDGNGGLKMDGSGMKMNKFTIVMAVKPDTDNDKSTLMALNYQVGFNWY